jgi:predicted DNA-binding protein YlxM (UPF0122 family)
MPRYTKTLSEKLCLQIAEGASVRELCRDFKINRAAFYQWLAKYEDFRNRYQAALLLRADFLFDEMLTIADDGRTDKVTRTDKKGNEYEVTDMDVIQRSKLMVETRRYMIECLNRGKYAPKGQTSDTGELRIIVENSPDIK